MRLDPGIKNGLVHPLTLFVSIWGFCLALYAMHLSGLLVFTTSEVAKVVCWIVCPFVFAYLLCTTFYEFSPKAPSRANLKDVHDVKYLKRVELSLGWWFKCWIVLTAVEIVFSRGVPILWLISGGSKNYSQFGLPLIHVLASSLLAVLALANLGLYFLRGGRRRLVVPIFQVVWSVVIISRGVMMIALIQGVVLWVCLKGISLRNVLRTFAIFVAAILLFGYVGDYRLGTRSFSNLAQPSANYPGWLPSGVLWLYVYTTTPLGNLVNTSYTSRPSYDIRFPSTTVFFFPTPIRNAIYGSDSSLGDSGDLLNDSFNVSSAYIGPFKDYGYAGIACFSLLLGTLSAFFWRKRSNFRDQLLYAVIAQCLLLSIFWNFLFYNPFLGQIFWIYLLFSQKTFRIFPRANRLAASVHPVESSPTVPPGVQ